MDKYQIKVDEQGIEDFFEVLKLADIPPMPAWVPIKYEGETAPALADKVWAGVMTIDEMIAQLNRDHNKAYDVAKKENDMEPYYSIDKSVFDRTLPDSIKRNSKFFEGK